MTDREILFYIDRSPGLSIGQLEEALRHHAEPPRNLEVQLGRMVQQCKLVRVGEGRNARYQPTWFTGVRA